MKGRESGMPDETYWASFFDVDCILGAMRCVPTGDESIVEFGCGYGTFTLPVARLTVGPVIAFDIETEMVNRVNDKAVEAGLSNIQVEERDFLHDGSGLEDAIIDHVMIYNLLHIEESPQLLSEAHRILKPGGTLSVIHWNHDLDTPRGPPMAIRPRPGQCIRLAEGAGFQHVVTPDISVCCEHHYGLVFLAV